MVLAVVLVVIADEGQFWIWVQYPAESDAFSDDWLCFAIIDTSHRRMLVSMVQISMQHSLCSLSGEIYMHHLSSLGD